MIDSTVPRGLVGKNLQPRKKNSRPTGRVSKRDWLERALHLFVSGGIEAVKINDLARKLGVSKSGFYWHFRDRADLLEAMQHYWVDEFSRQFIEDTCASKRPLRDRLIDLVHAIRSKESGKLDLAFTSWAQHDPKVRAIVDEVRDLRIEFIQKLLSETGLSTAETETRARMFVVYFSWSEVMFEKTDGGLVGEDLERAVDAILNA